MPLYVYECPAGHRTEQIRTVEKRNEYTLCGADTGVGQGMWALCGEPMKLVPSAANPQVSGGTPKFYLNRG